MKRAVRITLIVLAALGAAGLGLRLFLTSGYLAGKVAARLEALYGGRVEIAGVAIGLTHSAVSGLKLFEGKDPASGVWLTAGAVRTDLSLWDLLRGDTTPGEVTITDAVVTLHWDRAGWLATHFPSSSGAGTIRCPALHVRGGRLVLEQVGRPTMTVRGIDADLQNEGERLALTCGLHDPAWGTWTVSGEVRPATGALALSLRTARAVHVTQAMLDQLPILPRRIWETVNLEGDTPASMTWRYLPENKALSYRIALSPVNTAVRIPGRSPDQAGRPRQVLLDAGHARGDVVIEDYVVRLRGVQGEAHGGTVFTNADLDFRGEVPRLDFSRIDVRSLQVAGLPESWSFPVTLRGRLSGTAALQFLLGPGGTETRGAGHGVISDTNLGGPITIDLRAGPKGFQFIDRAQGAGQTPPPGMARPIPAFGLAGPCAAAMLGLPPGAGQEPKPPAAQKAPPPPLLTIGLSMDRVDVGAFLKGLGLKLPCPVSGRFSFQVQVGIPTDTPGDLRAYRVAGTASADRFAVADLRLDEVRARVAYRDGVLRLEELRAVVPAGAASTAAPPASITGTATVSLVPAGELTADVAVRNIPAAQVASLVPGLAGTVGGTLSATLRGRVPVKRVQDPAAWDVTGTLTAPRLDINGLAGEALACGIRLHGGTLSVTDAQLQVAGAVLQGSGDVQVARPFRYQARVDLHDSDLAALAKLPPRYRPAVALAGDLRTKGEFRGTLEPVTLEASGTATARDLVAKGIKLQSLAFNWTGAGGRLTVANIKGRLYEGEVTGTAVLPLDGPAAGDADLHLQEIDAKALARALPSNPVRLTGRATGDLHGTLSAAEPDGRRDLTVRLTVACPRLRVQGIPTEQVSGSVAYRQGVADVQLQGQGLGGHFAVQGKVPIAGRGSPVTRAEGQVKVAGVLLSRLWPALGLREGLGPLHGAVSLEATFHPEDGAPAGSGRLLVRGLRWDQAALADSIQAEVMVSHDTVRLRNLTAAMGPGLVDGEVVAELGRPEQSRFSLRLNRVDAGRLLAPWPALAAQVQGPVDGRLRGTLGREWFGTAQFLLARGKVAGLDVSDWRVPLDWTLHPGTGRTQITIRDSGAQVALGRATGQASLTWEAGLRLDGQVRFLGVDVKDFLRQLGSGSQAGSGKVTGRLDFASADFRTLGDLTGSVDATLSQAQALSFPVLRQLVPFLSGTSSATTFDSGTLRATLSRGVIRFQQFALSSNLVQLMIEGTATLEGRLALEATGLPGRGGLVRGARGLLGRIPLIGPVSAALLTEATNSLSSRLIHLRITGTVRNPQIRYEPQFLLTEEAVRFFLGRAN